MDIILIMINVNMLPAPLFQRDVKNVLIKILVHNANILNIIYLLTNATLILFQTVLPGTQHQTHV